MAPSVAERGREHSRGGEYERSTLYSNVGMSLVAMLRVHFTNVSVGKRKQVMIGSGQEGGHVAENRVSLDSRSDEAPHRGIAIPELMVAASPPSLRAKNTLLSD